MKNYATVLICVLLSLLLLVSCAKEREDVTLTLEQGLTARQVAGNWNSGLSSLALHEDGTYLYETVTTPDHAEPRKSGGFITEGEYVVLDGYGVDDPDLFLSLRYDASRDELILEGENGYTLTRAAIPDEQPETNAEDWFGDYFSETAALSVGRGARDGVLLAAVTPVGGVTFTVNLTLDGDSAVCESFTLIREEDGVTLVASTEETESLAGRYTKS